MTINLDADLQNADWPKRSWDIMPLEPFLEALRQAPLSELRRVRSWPSFEFAPAAVRRIVEDRLA